jgi:SAM-dependent methyltransferase
VEPTERNRQAWDLMHRRRSAELAGEGGIPEPVLERLPDVSGKHVLQLQCGTGAVTAELVELGALVTAIDLSEEALAVARQRVEDVAYFHADVQSLPVEVRRGRFDLVFGTGVLEWLEDPAAWAAGVVSALRPGGELLLYDEHPVSARVDDSLRWRGDYFAPTGPLPLGVFVTAVTVAGLLIRSLEEFPAPALYPWRHQTPHVPRAFVLAAAKPAGD